MVAVVEVTPDHALIKKIMEGVKINLKTFDELMPVFFIGDEEGKFNLVAAPFENDRAKDYASQEVRKMALEMEAQVVVFVSEVWRADLDPEEAREYEANRHKFKSVREHPKAKECVMFQIETKTSTQVGHADILPGREMGEVHWMKPDSITGRFADFLGPKPSMH